MRPRSQSRKRDSGDGYLGAQGGHVTLIRKRKARFLRIAFGDQCCKIRHLPSGQVSPALLRDFLGARSVIFRPRVPNIPPYCEKSMRARKEKPITGETQDMGFLAARLFAIVRRAVDIRRRRA